MFQRHAKTAMAGKKPRPSERRHAARRWLGPQLPRPDEYIGGEKVGKYSHPEHQERDEGRNTPCKVDHAICGMIKIYGQPEEWRHVLVARANHRCCAFFAIAFPSVCSEQETEPVGYSAPIPMPRKNLAKRLIYKFKAIMVASDAPAGDEHGKEAMHTVVRARRGSGEGREECDDTGSTHLD